MNQDGVPVCGCVSEADRLTCSTGQAFQRETLIATGSRPAVPPTCGLQQNSGSLMTEHADRFGSVDPCRRWLPLAACLAGSPAGQMGCMMSAHSQSSMNAACHL